MRKLTRWGATLSIVVVISVFSKVGLAAIVPVNFSGPLQTFNGVATGFGTFAAAGSGEAFNAKTSKLEAFSLTPPLVHPLTVAGGFAKVKAEPVSVAPPALFNATPTAISDIANLNLDFLNGVTAPLTFNTMTLTSNSSIPLLQNITVDASGELSELAFNQTGAATLTPLGPNFGSFSVPGDVQFLLSNNFVTLAGIINDSLLDLAGTTSGALSGTYTISGPPGSAKITLDGTLGLTVPITGHTAFLVNASSPIALTVSATADLVASMLVNAGFHLEQDGLVVPEPGSVALMAIGLAMCGAFVWRRRR